PVTPEGELPRNETLYIGGLQWSRVVGWNPLSPDMNNAMGVTQNAASRTPIYETLYMYNPLTGKMHPLLAGEDYVWNDARTEVTVKLNPDAKWSDGTPVTAEDVAYTYATHLKYNTHIGVNNGAFVDRIEAKDAGTLVIYAKLDEQGKANNPMMVEDFIGTMYVLQKAYLQKVEERNGGDADKIKNDPCEDFVSSGPYTKFHSDDQKVVFVRDDNYWGQAASMWGKLPVPKYIAHGMYADNAAAIVGLTEGEIDVAQLFIENVQKLWLEKGLPISTFIDEAPYGICENLPTAFFNLNREELQNVTIRKAIAMAVDYDTIISTAMTNQSPTFKQVPRSMMNPTPGEQGTFDHDALKELQWAGNDIEGAKKLLDEAGIVDKDGDGIRELKGKKLSFNACCPYGWSDWQVAMEIVAAAGEKIGIEITTNFPDWAVYQTVATNGKQTDYDIFMFWTNSASMTQPWARCRWLLSSEYVGQENNWNGNFGGYSNPRADELLKLIPQEGDAAKLKEYYTELNKIYLTDVPSFGLMYRPNQFYTVNESVWTNYPSQDDGRNIPPLNLLDGYGIAGLYGLELVK
ncbi:MAG TPA: ABC transporter substrate-binding protein, partial [Feifaniaceae bacterium]|nr:ABC transporter substrate-binding protein [Feifaniaceae bacterium]